MASNTRARPATFMVRGVTPGTAMAKYVLMILADMANHQHVCWPSIGKLSSISMLSPSTVRKAIKQLEDDGLLEVSRGGHKSNTFALNLPLNGATGDEAPPLRLAGSTPSPDTPHPSATHTPPLRNTEPPPPPHGGAPLRNTHPKYQSEAPTEQPSEAPSEVPSETAASPQGWRGGRLVSRWWTEKKEPVWPDGGDILWTLRFDASANDRAAMTPEELDQMTNDRSIPYARAYDTWRRCYLEKHKYEPPFGPGEQWAMLAIIEATPDDIPLLDVFRNFVAIDQWPRPHDLRQLADDPARFAKPYVAPDLAPATGQGRRT